MPRLCGCFIVCALMITSVSTWARVPIQPVHQFRLKNGLTLLVKQDHRAPVVISSVWYKVGAAYESKGITGISHVLEHMMFRGTKQHASGEFSHLIAQLGGQENAFTSDDYTGYYQVLPVEQLKVSFQLEADRMQHLLLTDEHFKKEIQVVMEERRLRTDDSPQAVTVERFLAAAHVANPYHHPVVGWMSDLKNMTVADVQRWYDTWYAPNNAVVVVVGDVKPERVLALATRYFGRIPSKKMPLLKPHPEVRSLGPRTLTVKLPARLPWLVMGYNVPVLRSLPATKWKAYALEVLAGVLDEGDSARLPRHLVRGQQFASDVGVSYDPYALYDDVFMVYGTPAEGQSVKTLRQGFLNQIHHVRNELVSKTELDRVKAQIIASHIYQQDSILRQAMQLGRLLVVGQPWQESDRYIEHIEAVNAEEVRAVARQYLCGDNLTLAVLQPLPLSKKVESKRSPIGVKKHAPIR